jgi:hypothetical protein
MRRLTLTVVVLLLACDGEGKSRDSGTHEASEDLTQDMHRPDSSPLSRAVELTSTPGRIGRRELIFDGEHFAAVWVFLASSEVENRVMFARVSEAGAVVDGPVELLVTDHHISDLRLLKTADGFTLLHRPQETYGKISALVLDEEGKALAPSQELEGFSTAWANRHEDGLGVAWSGQQYRMLAGQSEVVSGVYHYRLKTRLFEKDLTPVAPSALIDPQNENQYEPHVSWLPGAAGGSGAFWMLWRGANRIRGALVDTAGKTLSGPGLLLDNTETQVRPRVALDDKGRALASWKRGDLESPRFLLVDTKTAKSLWSQPAAWVPQNRVAWLDYGVAVRGDRALCAWHSDAETSLPRIRVGEVDLSSSSPTLDQGSLVSLSDPTYPAYTPRVAAGAKTFGVIFSSVVKGSDHLYIRLVP